MVSLRQRNRLNAMRITQRTALELFQARGFDEVTVAEIAATAGLAPSTVYRHFETKEAIVLWDEHDPDIDSDLERRFRAGQPPLAAIRDTFVEVLAPPLDDDWQRARIQYIYATEALHGAAVEADFRSRAELAEALAQVLGPDERSRAPLLAGAAMLALDIAIDRWQAEDGSQPLAGHIADAFDQLISLDRYT